MTDPTAFVRSAPLASYRTPGVRLEWLDAGPQTPALVRTDIAGFVGLAERGPLHLPVRVASWEEFTGVFGGHLPQAQLAYAVEGFFANGGVTCWVVRAANPDEAKAATVQLPGRPATGDGTPPYLLLRATSPGIWGNRITAQVRPDPQAPNRFALILRLGSVMEIWRDLTHDTADARDAVRLLNAKSTGSRLVAAGWPTSPDQPTPTPVGPLGGEFTLSGGADGYVGLSTAHLAGHQQPSQDPWGLAALAAVDEVSLVSVPDCWWPAFQTEAVATLQREIVRHCEELGDRVALLDPPGRPAGPVDVLAWPGRLDASSYAALYHPWVLVVDPRSPGTVRAVPPSGHVAGVCARVDRSAGVHKPPAGEVVELAVDVDAQIDDLTYGEFNDAGIDVLRADRTVRVMGARTLSTDPAWRYLSVRRLMLMIEESIVEATAWTTFEPNGPRLWAEFERVVRGVLDGLWLSGSLGGATRTAAYSVVCDASVNPSSETTAGRLVCLVGVNPPPPAEFVVIRVVRTPTGIRIGSQGGSDG